MLFGQGKNNLKILVGKSCWLLPAVVVGCTNADATTLFLPLGRWEPLHHQPSNIHHQPSTIHRATVIQQDRPQSDDLVRFFVAHALFKVSCINIFIYCATHSHTLRASLQDALLYGTTATATAARRPDLKGNGNYNDDDV